MANLRDFTGKNRKFTGSIGERISVGTTGERDTSTYGHGTLRFNTTTSLLEYYNRYPKALDNSHPGQLAHKEYAEKIYTCLTY